MAICCRALILFLCFFLTLSADDDDEMNIVVLPSSAVIDNDYFVSGRTVEISGTVNGDVYVLGGQVFIDGTINGDVLVAAGSVEISGRVTKNVRILAGQASITGNIEQNLTAVAATIELNPGATIGRNVVIVAGNADLESVINRNAHLYSSSVRISNLIHGKVAAYVGHLRVTSKVVIDGPLEYWSNNNALIDSHAQITGGVLHHPSFFYNLFQSKIMKGLKLGSKLAGLVMNFFYSFIIGLIMLKYFPQRIQRTIEMLNMKPIQSLIAGIVLLFVLPMTFLALIITILGVPFALTLLSLTIVTFYTAKIFSILWLSTHIFRRFEFRRHKSLYLAFGLLVYFSLTLIPYLGTTISIAALLLGMGGAVLGKIEKEPSKGIVIH